MKLKNGRAIKWLATFCIFVTCAAASTRCDLPVTVVDDGKLRAIKNHSIFPQLRGQTRITWLVPEGSTVHKGDKLVEFEKKPLQELLQTRTTDLEGAKREIVVKAEALTIQRSTAKADVAAAETKQ